MAKKYNLIDDGYHPELVQQALFAGKLEIPIISPPQGIHIPKSLTPFSKRRYTGSYDTAICEYEHDIKFAELVFNPSLLAEKFAFLGVPKNSILSIGTYGCIRGSENKYYFKAGLDAMLQELTPKVVLVYGAMSNDIFKDYLSYTTFVQYDDWTTRKRKEK